MGESILDIFSAVSVTEELAKKLGKRASEADQTNRKTLEHYFKI